MGRGASTDRGGEKGRAFLSGIYQANVNHFGEVLNEINALSVRHPPLRFIKQTAGAVIIKNELSFYFYPLP
jgi:hypothetical protein